MKLSKTKAYLLGLAIILLPLIATKLIWLIGSSKTEGVVVQMRQIRLRGSKENLLPVYEYVVDGEIITGFGNYNLPFNKGDRVPLRYSRSKPSDVLWNTFEGVWTSTALYALFPFLVLTIIFLHRDIIPKEALIEISKAGIKIVDNYKEFD